jgi:CRISPR-associated protein Cas1
MNDDAPPPTRADLRKSRLPDPATSRHLPPDRTAPDAPAPTAPRHISTESPNVRIELRVLAGEPHPALEPLAPPPAPLLAGLSITTAPDVPAAPAVPCPAFTDPIPARMLNEFIYCPRLFYYEFVEGVFVENADTLRGKALHMRVDQGTGALPEPKSPAAKEPTVAASTPNTPAETGCASKSPDMPGEAAATPREARALPAPEVIHSRSVQMGSERLGVTAKMDLVESRTGGDDLFSATEVCPVDYKAGAPREGAEANELWDADKMQLGLQCLILRDNGYRCDEGVI